MTESPAPGTPQTSTKAWVAATFGSLVTFLSGLQIAVSEGVTTDEWIGIALATLIAFGGGFGLTHQVANRAKV